MWVSVPSPCNAQSPPAQPNTLNPWGLMPALPTPSWDCLSEVIGAFPKFGDTEASESHQDRANEKMREPLMGEVFIS